MTDKPNCYEDRPHLKHHTVRELERIQQKAQLWAAIPEHIQGALTRYFERRIYPGYTLHSLLIGDVHEAGQSADEPTQEAMVSIAAWIAEFAPEGSWGDAETVRGWLEWRPKDWGVSQ